MSGPSSSRRSDDRDSPRIRTETHESHEDSFSLEGSHGQTPRVKRVQQEWEHRNFYVPTELDDLLESVRAEMEDSLKQEFGGQLAVTRHFYAVMIYLGLAHIGDLSPMEFAAQVDRIPGVESDEFRK